MRKFIAVVFVVALLAATFVPTAGAFKLSHRSGSGSPNCNTSSIFGTVGLAKGALPNPQLHVCTNA